MKTYEYVNLADIHRNLTRYHLPHSNLTTKSQRQFCYLCCEVLMEHGNNLVTFERTGDQFLNYFGGVSVEAGECGT